jgi:glycosyltransferase involved in cell wall biosynthesis
MTSRPRACLVGVVRPALDVRTHHRHARALAAAGWDVTVIGRDPGRARVENGVRIVPLAPGRGLRRAFAQATALRAALASRADVFQVTDVELLPAARLLAATGRPVVWDAIEDYPAYMELKAWIPRPLRRPAATAVAAVERLVVPRLAAVLAADAATAARLRRLHWRVVLLHNFPRRDEFAPAAPGAPRPDDVLYHGSLPPYHLEALAAIAAALVPRFPNVRLTLVGRPDTRAARFRFDRALADAGIADRVRLRPRVPFDAVPALVRGTRTGVVPLPDVAKFRTNVPMKLFEFMAAGVPAVTSDLPPARGLVGEDCGVVFVPPGDAAAFADALGGLLGDPSRAAHLGRRGRELVLERCHWEREEPALVALFDGLRGSGRSPRREAA